MANAGSKLMTIFSEALEKSGPGERKAYLDQTCEDDADLRRRVELMLRAHDEADRNIEANPDKLGGPTSSRLKFM